MSTQRRTRFYDVAGRETPYLAVTAGDALFLVRTQDRNVGRSLFIAGGRGEMHVLSRAVTLLLATGGKDAVRGRQFIDVGANIGTTTVPALLEHRFATAVSFEPEPENLITLRLNLILNGLEERASTFGLAISNVAGSSELVVNPEQGGKHWIATDGAKGREARGDGTRVIEVETATLDQLAADGAIDLDRAGLVWCDAQGHEGHVLEGATSLMDRGLPIVLEWSPKSLERLGKRATLETMVAAQYSHFVDLRADPTLGTFELRPASELAVVAERLLDPAQKQSFTDILLLSLSPRVAQGLDVNALLRGGEARDAPRGDGSSLLAEIVAELGARQNGRSKGDS